MSEKSPLSFVWSVIPTERRPFWPPLNHRRAPQASGGGGGTKGGAHYGKSDDFGYKAVEDKVSVHDLQATILHLMGLDHTKLTYRHNGRDFRLTDVAGRVIKAVIS